MQFQTLMPDGFQNRNFLLVLWDGGGNVAPQLTIARRLIQRGHIVRILAPRVLEQRITASGCTFVPYCHTPEHDSSSPEHDLLRDWEPRTPLGAAARARDRVMAGTALTIARDVIAALEEQPADVILADYLLLGAILAAERAEVPVATLVHHIYPFPDPALPPFGLGLQPANGIPSRVRDRLLRPVFARFYGAALPGINNARAEIGLAPLASIFDLVAAPERILVLTSRAFDFPAELPDNVRYCGVQHDDFANAVWDNPWQADDERPLVVVSLSTTYQRQADVLRRVITAVADLPARVLVTTGPALDQQSLPTAENVVVRAFVSHRAVVPHARLVVTHGGHGTVLTALAAGIPVLCLPMGRDQADVAARARWHGAGRIMSPRSSPARLRRTITEMLDDSGMHAAARSLAADMTRAEAKTSAVNEVEALATRNAIARGIPATIETIPV